MLELYHCPGTRSLRSLWLLHELRVPFRLHEMPFDLAALRSPEYLAIHPLGRVPCLVHGGLRLFESGAIAQHLCELYPEKGLGRAVADPERCEWLQWIHFAETMASHLSALVQQHRFVAQGSRSGVTIDLETRRLGKCVQVIEEHLRCPDSLLGSGFSAADIGIACTLHLAEGVIDLNGWPRSQAYVARLRRRAAFKAAITGAAADG